MTLIDKSIDISVYHMFKNNKSVLTAKTLTKLQKEVKERIKPPSKDVKVFIMNFNFSPDDDDYVFRIICGQYTITPKLGMVMKEDDHAQTIRYNNDEFKKYGFKKSHISKIINAMKNDLISYESLGVSITDILNAE